MPPQQGKGIADGLGELLGFGAHDRAPWRAPPARATGALAREIEEIQERASKV
jgi:hypothetical protein